jgi:hypothetical protein
MPLSTTVILFAIVAMFAAFIGVIGVVSTWTNLSEARESAAADRRKRSAARAA